MVWMAWCVNISPKLSSSWSFPAAAGASSAMVCVSLVNSMSWATTPFDFPCKRKANEMITNWFTWFSISLSTYVRIRFLCAQNVQRFSQQHPRNAQQANDQEYSLNCSLSVEHEFIAIGNRFGIFEQHHVNEQNQNRWSAGWRVDGDIGFVRVENPFQKHHEHHVAEQQHQEQHLRQEFQ